MCLSCPTLELLPFTPGPGRNPGLEGGLPSLSFTIQQVLETRNRTESVHPQRPV